MTLKHRRVSRFFNRVAGHWVGGLRRAIAGGVLMLIMTSVTQAAGNITLSPGDFKRLEALQDLLNSEAPSQQAVADENWETLWQAAWYEAEGDSPGKQLMRVILVRFEASRAINEDRASDILPRLKATLAEHQTDSVLPAERVQDLRWTLVQTALAAEQDRLALQTLKGWMAHAQTVPARADHLAAVLYARQSDWEDAAKFIDQALRKVEGTPQDGWLALGVKIYDELKRYPRAIELQRLRLDLAGPDQENQWTLLAQLQRQAGQHRSALATLQAGWRQGAVTSPNTLRWLVQSLLQQDQPLESAHLLQRWAESHPRQVTHRDRQWLAESWRRARQYDKAVEAYAAYARGIRNDDPRAAANAYRQIAGLAQSHGDWRRVIDSLDQALSVMPGAQHELRQKLSLLQATAWIELNEAEQAQPLLSKLNHQAREEGDETLAKQTQYWLDYLKTTALLSSAMSDAADPEVAKR
ncbi:hypothetical protein BFW38_08655 [Terasakiispira papahanaumokuakeensis]|uniref:Uncharacterized protein n=1 Tax=Terasakiispira papahanaumokuakeensis TaxID=197479 RepID=A0A1E2V9F0_9GAMM|nr:tetratricopeptide repeat protein [Terasakiispira papahanaumokuakeensis]ODC03604.1 hypothetical protein BFW38_08655 [Terasakiispira papahanaumokuakeensis]